jgi:hypothetical protein
VCAPCSFRRQDYISRAPFLQFPAGGFENHLTEPALERKGFGSFGKIDGLAVKVAAEMKGAEPFAGFFDGNFPTQILIAWRLIA